MQPVIAIIGAGNMGSSIIGGLVHNGHPPKKLWASDPSETKLAQLKETYGMQTTTNNAVAIQQANVIIFALKPQVFKKVVSGLATALPASKPLIISVAAGIQVHHIAQWLDNKQLAIVRAMPNTPALIRCGATALFANQWVSAEERNQAEAILRAVGIVVWVTDEKLMDAVTALSGSGPAYFFLMMEILQQVAGELGLESSIAHLLTLHTALGAARMAIESGKSLTELRQQVTSPGGTTEKALAVLEENNLYAVFKQALHAAALRAKELAECA